MHMPDWAHLFTGYILPFLMVILVVAYVALKVRSLGGPGMLVAIFSALLFGPSLVYAFVTDESSGALFGASLAIALVVVAVLAVKGGMFKKPGG